MKVLNFLLVLLFAVLVVIALAVAIVWGLGLREPQAGVGVEEPSPATEAERREVIDSLGPEATTSRYIIDEEGSVRPSEAEKQILESLSN